MFKWKQSMAGRGEVFITGEVEKFTTTSTNSSDGQKMGWYLSKCKIWPSGRIHQKKKVGQKATYRGHFCRKGWWEHADNILCENQYVVVLYGRKTCCCVPEIQVQFVIYTVWSFFLLGIRKDWWEFGFGNVTTMWFAWVVVSWIIFTENSCRKQHL